MPFDPSIPQIEPHPPGTVRPTWSVMIPTFNNVSYLPQTIESVLEQWQGPSHMEIWVVDGFSDKVDPQPLVRSCGQGVVNFFRQPSNLGASADFTTCIRLAKGRIVHILHADDFVKPGFYQKLEAAFDNKEVGAAFCRYSYVDSHGSTCALSTEQASLPGVLPGYLDTIACHNMIETPAMTVARETYEAIGGFHSDLVHTADWEMWARIGKYFQVWYEPEHLACFRRHEESGTSRFIRTGANVRESRKAVDMISSYTSTDIRSELKDKSYAKLAFYAFATAYFRFRAGDMPAAVAQLCETGNCLRTIASFKHFALDLTTKASKRIRRKLGR